MAIVNVSIGCGCGFNTQKIEVAIKHADENSHELCVSGSVKPSEPKTRKVSSSTSSSTLPRIEPIAVTPTQDEVDFVNMRARLQRKLDSKKD